MTEIMIVPKLRFPGFNDQWSQVLLGDISENVMYGLNSAATTFDGLNKYIRITNPKIKYIIHI